MIPRLNRLVAERVCGLSIGPRPHQQRSCPAYSTDMNAALEAAERSKGPPPDHDFTWAIELAWVEDAPERTGWLATVQGHDSDFHPSPATALCLALLRAAGVDEDEIAEAMEGES